MCCIITLRELFWQIFQRTTRRVGENYLLFFRSYHISFSTRNFLHKNSPNKYFIMPSPHFFKQWHISRTIFKERSPLHHLFSDVTSTNFACICNRIRGKYTVFVFVVFLTTTIFYQYACKNKTDEGRTTISNCLKKYLSIMTWWKDRHGLLRVPPSTNLDQTKPCLSSFHNAFLITFTTAVSFATTDEFSVRITKITSKIGISWTHGLLFCFWPIFYQRLI